MAPKKIVFIVNNIGAFEALGMVATEAISIELTEEQQNEIEVKMGKQRIILSTHISEE